jgi:hypothetical protein
LNLRPPGPQPEGWGIAESMGPVLIGFLASECASVALNLFPNLFPNTLAVAPPWTLEVARLLGIAVGRPTWACAGFSAGSLAKSSRLR